MTREEFNALPQGLRDRVRKEYSKICENGGSDSDFDVRCGVLNILVNLFGEENLQDESQIRTWDDLAKTDKAYIVGAVIKEIIKVSPCRKNVINYTFSGTPIEKKALATLKIAQLIDVAYGGMVSSAEQRYNRSRFSFGMSCGEFRVISCFCKATPDILAFHTEQQAEDFLKYNEDLIKDYYML